MQSGILKSKYASGVFFVNGQEWKVGERYEVRRLLGTGSFSSVCCALDCVTSQEVALKRIPDILSSPELARRVLREVCILRRVQHPFIISLLDAFLTPASTGQYRMVEGRLVSVSLDCYLVMELGEDGDLFNLRGQMSAEEVRLMMWQMLHALKYLHALNVWHRDIKSSNVMLGRKEGHKIVKLADFGSSRSANQEGYHFAEQGAPEPCNGGARLPVTRRVILEQKAQHTRGEIASSLRFAESEEDALSSKAVETSDIYVQLGQAKCKGEGVGFFSPLTRVVATPCYRAPEVVMSRGGYTDAVDMWSLGCIFGELLQRVTRVGSADTPHLKIAPLFAIHEGILKTPGVGERWSSAACPGDVTTRSELLALFDVIGTPSWADAEGVQTQMYGVKEMHLVQAPVWRSYLQRLPGRAPTLSRRFSFAGEPAVHLLSRLLAFNPDRRCTADEALQHEFFSGLESSEDPDAGKHVWQGSLVESMDGATLVSQHSATTDPVVQDLKSEVDAAWEEHATKKSRTLSPRPPEGEASQSGGEDCQEMLKHMADDSDPARALAELESGMGGSGSVQDQIARLRVLLERECESQAKQAQHPRLEQDSKLNWMHRQGASGHKKSPSDTLEGLMVDDGQSTDASAYAQARLSNTADTWLAKLDAAAHLKPGRHGEWWEKPVKGTEAGPRWGVSMVPPGDTAGLDPEMLRVIRSQQLR